MTITEFLLARIAEDEARAPQHRVDFHGRPCPRCGEPVEGLAFSLDEEAAVRALHDDRFGIGGPTRDGRRVLAECEAKRRIVEREAEALHSEWRRRSDEHRLTWDDWLRSMQVLTLRDLASVYADHPDYDQAWRVS